MSHSSGLGLLGRQRKRQGSRIRTWALVMAPVAAILFQVYVPLFFPPLGYLEMPLLVVVYFGLTRRDPIRGLLIGAAVGLAQDCLSKNPLGLFGIAKTLVGYFASSLGVRLDMDRTLSRFLAAYFFFLFHQGFYWVLMRALLRQPLALEPGVTLVAGLFNAVVAAGLYYLLDKLRASS